MEFAIAFGFACQVLLLAFFVAYRRRPALATVLGNLAYAMGTASRPQCWPPHAS